MCNAAAPLELDQSNTHILDIIRPKSRTELLWQFCMTKSVIWGLMNPCKLDDKVKLFVAWLCD